MAEQKSLTNIRHTFSLYGLTIARDLSIIIHRFLQRIEPEEQDSWLTSIVDHIVEQNLESPHVTSESIQRATAECIRPEATLQESETVFNVLDTFEVPQIIYDPSKKKFVLKTINQDLYSDAVHKSLVFKNRLELLWQRTLRHEMFTPVKFGEPNAQRYELTPIEFLLSESKTGHVYVMGLLSQLTEGRYYLEDTGGSVKIDLKKAEFQAGLITEGCVVIANGIYDDGVLHVKDIGFPPPETTENSRAPFGDENTFGGKHPSSLKNSEKLKAYEQANSSAMIVFISEFWVDNVRVLEKFETMLEGYNDFPPVAFVLCGQFLSFPPNMTSAHMMKDGFRKLAEIIQKYPEIKKNSKFVLVPGPNDLGSPRILPRGPLPNSLLDDFVKRVPDTILATNPCRIQYCTKEIIVFREDMLMKLVRNTLKFPTTGQIYEHYAKSIICQSHLAPMSLPVTPVYWKHDHALQVFPTPDLIVVADKFECYTTSYEDCQVINPGTFARNNFSFKVYVPTTNTIEDCEIPDNND